MSTIKQILQNAKGMILDGIAASEHIDSSGEILDVEGCDISAIEDGVATINYEHKGDSPKDTIGRIIYGKKIFSEKDCEDDRQLTYWKKSGVPYIYIISELMDQDGHEGAKSAAAIIRHYASRKLPVLARWSIEGSTLKKEKNRLKQSIFKRLALTLAPCNKDATSGLLFDPISNTPKDGSLQSIMDKMDKFEHPSYIKLGGSMEIECIPLLEKTEEPQEDLKDKIKRLIKDWDGKEDIKTFVKTNLPEASDDFIEKFAELADGMKLKIKKFEKLEHNIELLIKAVSPDVKVPESIEFGGKKIKPGEGLLFNKQALTHSPVSLIGRDPDSRSYFAIPKGKINSWSDLDIQKISSGDINLRIDSYPEEIETPAVIDSSLHGVNLSPESAALVHGMDLDPKNKLATKHLGNNYKAHWAKNAHGKLVFVKPDLENDTFAEAEREGAFHNLAKDFFGLGKHVPTVATVRHPKTGQLHAVIEAVDGEHAEYKGYGKDKGMPKSQEHINTLKKMGDSGELDKLGLMDHILNNDDRNPGNYMFTPDGSIKLFDHGLTFSSGHHGPLLEPDYLYAYRNISKNSINNPDTDQIHPETAKWLMTLDASRFKAVLRKNGVPPNETKEAVQRLLAMQQELTANPNSNRFNVYNAPLGVKMAG
jgi:hypothetical protein